MIYFAQTGDNRYIKIGYAGDVSKRLDALQTASPIDLKLLASMPGDHKLERALHERFEWLRERREWFRTHEEIVRLAVSASRLAGISADDDPFLRYAILEPRLIDLLVEAATAQPDDEGGFCANGKFFGYSNVRGGLKWRLSKLVGWGSTSHIPALHTEDAYDTVYERIYEALPDCRDCGCITVGARDEWV